MSELATPLPPGLTALVTPPSAPAAGAESTEQTSREDAFWAALAWRGKPLFPWSLSAERLYRHLRIITGAPLLAEIRGHRDTLNESILVLFTASMPGEKRTPCLTMSRTALIDLMNNWADSSIAPHETEAVCDLATLILNQRDINRAVPAPSEGGDSTSPVGE